MAAGTSRVALCRTTGIYRGIQRVAKINNNAAPAGAGPNGKNRYGAARVRLNVTVRIPLH